MPHVSSLTATEHEESWEGSRGAGMWMLSAPALWRLCWLSLKTRSFTTLGGRDFVFIYCDGQITHFMDVQSESQRLMSVSGAGHEGSSVDPGSSVTVLAYI